MPVLRPIKKNILETMLGSAKGNLMSSLSWPKSFGCFAAGFAKAPPRAGPKILPIVHIKGMILKALGCRFLYGTISATMVRMIPTFPFEAPAIDLTIIAQVRDREKPKSRLVVMVQVKPIKIVGFRPKRSDACPQNTAVTH